MGKKTHSYEEMKKKREERIRTKGDFFSYDRTVRKSKVKETHASLNPAHGGLRHIAEGELVSVLFDVTGSYSNVPRKVQADLPELFSRLVTNKWMPGKLNLQFGAIGDITCDNSPLQLSQAEADGVTADKWLGNLYLEGGGGGTREESYELAFWSLVNQNKFEGWNAGKKGNAFIIFDEIPYRTVLRDRLIKLYSRYSSATLKEGEQISNKMMRKSTEAGEDSVVLPMNNISTDEMASQMLEKYDVWAIMIEGTSYWGNTSHLSRWKDLFGYQNVIELHEAENISELIAGIIGAKYQSVSDAEIEATLNTSIHGSFDTGVIERAMADVKRLPSTVNFSLNASSSARYLPHGDDRTTRL